VKRTIILSLALHTLLFLSVGGYLSFKIHYATADVHRVLRLHDVELLREDFLVRLHAVQSGLARSAVREGPTPTTVAEDLAGLERALGACFGCHHSEDATARLMGLREQTGAFRAALAADHASGGHAVLAFEEGEQLLGQVILMVDLTHRRLGDLTAAASRELAHTRYVACALLLFGPLLSAVLGLAMLRSLTHPLDALRAATRRLQAGDLAHRVHGLEHEFGELAASFNAMASALQDEIALLQRTGQMVVVGELAAGLVHEIKNPLAGIKAAVQVLSREATVSPEDRGVLEQVAREVVGLEGLLRGFLEFARPAKPQLAEVDVNALVESTTAFFLRSHAQSANPLRIGKDLGTVPAARTDAMQLRQILLNLLINAGEATPGGGPVEIRTRYDGAGQVLVEVSDHGNGIRPEHADQIFRPFFTTKPKGTGLGLAVSKRLAEQHGGDLGFEPNAGGGTTFRLSLPAAGATGAGRAA
jgi:signal transduction histidine kinase